MHACIYIYIHVCVHVRCDYTCKSLEYPNMGCVELLNQESEFWS